MKYKNKYSLTTAAAKSGMCSKTARQYIQAGELPSECKKARTHRTRADCFASVWEEIAEMLQKAPELQAKTILYYLMEKYPKDYQELHLRSLQRRVKQYRAEYGKDKPVIFSQKLKPGQTSQSDWTVMDSLNVTIAKAPFPHLLFHFMLPYSQWESIMICYSESFDSLSSGYAKAVLELGGVLPVHRTDNLTAATQRAGNSRSFTKRWQEFLEHYQVTPSRNNPGQSHENGSVEKSHDLFKNAVRQHLLLRGSSDFADLKSYELFLHNIKEKRNCGRRKKLAEEVDCLKSLPERNWKDPIIFDARVSTFSTIQILSCTYSVPSRLISYILRVHVYADFIELYYGQKLLLTMPRLEAGIHIDYRHIIDSLVRKPGAFANYIYRTSLFPQPIFRLAFDQLDKEKPATSHKQYLKILQMAKCHGEANVVTALQLCLEMHVLPEAATIADYLKTPSIAKVETRVMAPNLTAYDNLHDFGGIAC
jgi:hypothetical protein